MAKTAARASEPTRHRFTVADYYRMADLGILDEDSRVELIEGEIIDMTPIGNRHAACVDLLTELMVSRFSDVAQVRVQNPVRLAGDTEPQPDLALLHRRPDRYGLHQPRPEDIFVLVEVADTTANWDRRVKLPLYARSGVPEVWLVDLAAETITVYRDPTASGHQTVRTLRRGDRVAPAAFPDRELAVADMLV